MLGPDPPSRPLDQESALIEARIASSILRPLVPLATALAGLGAIASVIEGETRRAVPAIVSLACAACAWLLRGRRPRAALLTIALAIAAAGALGMIANGALLAPVHPAALVVIIYCGWAFGFRAGTWAAIGSVVFVSLVTLLHALGRLPVAPEPSDAFRLTVLLILGGLTWIGAVLPQRALRQAMREALASEDEQRRRIEKGQLLTQTLRREEQERSRLSRELHERIAQDVAATFLKIDRALAAESVEAARAELDALAPARATILEALGAATERLQPQALRLVGLEAAVQQLILAYTARTACRFQLQSQMPTARALPGLLALDAFRILQAAISNVSQHADASHADISIALRDGVLSLVVRDEGRGFDASAVGTSPLVCFGLLSMTHRAESWGGTLRIESAPGEGTTVDVRIPVPERRPAEPPEPLPTQPAEREAAPRSVASAHRG